MFQENTKKRKAGEIIGIIVIFILAVLIVCTFVVYGIFRDANKAPSVFGHRIYLMNGDGMEPRIKQGSAVFIDEGTMPETEGNVILCDIDGRLAVVGYQGSQDVTMPDGSVQRKYIVKYDNAPADQVWAVDEADIIGRATSYDTTLGAVIRFASSKTGMLIIVIVPCALLVVYEVIMLIISLKNGKTQDDMEFEEIETLDAAEFNTTPRQNVLDFGTMPRADEPKADKQIINEQKPQAPAADIPKAQEIESSVGEGAKKVEKSVFTAERNSVQDVKLEFSNPKPAPVPTPAPAPVQNSVPEPESYAGLESAAAVQRAEMPVSTPAPQQEASSQTPEQKISDTVSAFTSSIESEEQSMTSRIDELIKLLEEEKAKLAGK